jgi:hypothetical protein
MDQHAATEELLEAVFSVVCTTAVAVQWHGKRICAAMNQHSAIEELLEMVFSPQSVRRVIKGMNLELSSQTPVWRRGQIPPL